MLAILTLLFSMIVLIAVVWISIVLIGVHAINKTFNIEANSVTTNEKLSLKVES